MMGVVNNTTFFHDFLRKDSNRRVISQSSCSDPDLVIYSIAYIDISWSDFLSHSFFVLNNQLIRKQQSSKYRRQIVTE